MKSFSEPHGLALTNPKHIGWAAQTGCLAGSLDGCLPGCLLGWNLNPSPRYPKFNPKLHAPKANTLIPQCTHPYSAEYTKYNVTGSDYLLAKIDFDTGENEPFQNLVNFVFSARMHSSLRKRILTENGFFTAKVKARAVARALRDSSRAVAGFAREQRPAA